MQPAAGKPAGKIFFEDTYFIEGTEKNPDSGSLAIRVEINFDTHRIAWQDTTLHPKSRHFDHVIFEKDGTLDIEEGGKHLKLRLLTLELFQRYIHSNVPQEALESDDILRRYFVYTAS